MILDRCPRTYCYSIIYDNFNFYTAESPYWNGVTEADMVTNQTLYNAFNVYRRELAPGTVSLTGDRAQGDDSKHWAYSTLNTLK